MSKNGIPSWIESRSKILEQRKIDNSKFYKIPEGETTIEVSTAVPPIEVEKFNKKRSQYTIIVNGKEQILECGITLDSLILKALKQNLNPMTIIRVRTDIKTSYSIKGLSE